MYQSDRSLHLESMFVNNQEKARRLKKPGGERGLDGVRRQGFFLVSGLPLPLGPAAALLWALVSSCVR